MMELLYYAYIVIFTIGLTIPMFFLGRMSGGGYWKLPLGLDQWLLSVPIAASAAFLVDFSDPIWKWSLEIAIPTLIALRGYRMGHGLYLPYLILFNNRSNLSFLESAGEKMDAVLDIFFGKDVRTTQKFHDANVHEKRELMKKYGLSRIYWRNFFGMGLTGLLVTTGISGLLILNGMFLWAGLFAIAGFAKSVSYSIGWFLIPGGHDKLLFEEDHWILDELEDATGIAEHLKAVFIALVAGPFLAIETWELIQKYELLSFLQ